MVHFDKAPLFLREFVGQFFGGDQFRALREAHQKVSPLCENVASALCDSLSSFRPSDELTKPSDIMGRSVYDLAALHPDGLRLVVCLGGCSSPFEGAVFSRAKLSAEAFFSCPHFTALGCRSEVEEVKRHYEGGPNAGSLDAVRDSLSLNLIQDCTDYRMLDAFIGRYEERWREPVRALTTLLIAEQANFVSTPDILTPSTWYSEFEDQSAPDVAAVLSGTKPAALTTRMFLKQDVLGREFLRAGKEMGLASFWLGDPEEAIIGVPEAVREFEALQRDYTSSGGQRDPDPHYHRVIGRILGYPEQCINAFIGRA